MAGKGFEKYFPDNWGDAPDGCGCSPRGSGLVCTRQQGHTGIHIAATRYFKVYSLQFICGWWAGDGVLQPKETLPDFSEASGDPERIFGRSVLISPPRPNSPLPGDRVVTREGIRGTVKQTRKTPTRGFVCKVVYDGHDGWVEHAANALRVEDCSPTLAGVGRKVLY